MQIYALAVHFLVPNTHVQKDYDTFGMPPLNVVSNGVTITSSLRIQVIILGINCLMS